MAISRATSAYRYVSAPGILLVSESHNLSIRLLLPLRVSRYSAFRATSLALVSAVPQGLRIIRRPSHALDGRPASRCEHRGRFACVLSPPTERVIRSSMDQRGLDQEAFREHVRIEVDHTCESMFHILC